VTEATVRHHYNRLSTVYDLRWRRYTGQTLEFLKSWICLSATETVLDVACGTGELERLILAEHATQPMIGVDISEQMLAIAQQKLQAIPTVLFQVATATALPFPDHQFDVVISANAFHYFEPPLIALQEMQRVLKPNGRLVILDWCRDFFVCQICDIVLKLIDPAHRQCYTQKEFHHLLTTAGFTIKAAQQIQFGWLWGLMIATGVRS
jgi:ubiquinone/menaquinone biosynthesis C-methylase UbiE